MNFSYLLSAFVTDPDVGIWNDLNVMVRFMSQHHHCAPKMFSH